MMACPRCGSSLLYHDRDGELGCVACGHHGPHLPVVGRLSSHEAGMNYRIDTHADRQSRYTKDAHGKESG